MRTGGGTWLLDPYDVTIASGNARDGVHTASPYTYTPGSASTILNTSIDAALNAGNNVVIQTAGTAGTSNGDITVNAPSRGRHAGLTLNAAGNIRSMRRSAASGSAPGLTLDYGQSSTNGAGASYSIAAPVSLPSNATFVTQAGRRGGDYLHDHRQPGGAGDYRRHRQLRPWRGHRRDGHQFVAPHLLRHVRGLGNTISNLTINGGDNTGLFGTLGSGGVIRDLGLVGERVTGGSDVGGW